MYILELYPAVTESIKTILQNDFPRKLDWPILNGVAGCGVKLKGYVTSRLRPFQVLSKAGS